MAKQLSYRGNERPFLLSPNKIIPTLTIVLFVVLVGIALFRLFYQVRTISDEMISREVVQLVDIFKRIDKKCRIISFDYQKNHINFLNVKSFVGSEVGPMNLVYPENWEGPYLEDNPIIQGKEYQIVNTKKGYFITPGDGVVLNNRKVVGKDIILDENADIPAMMLDENALNFKGKALAAPLPVGVSAIGKVALENIVRAGDGLVMEEQIKSGVHLASQDKLHHVSDERGHVGRSLGEG